LAEAFAGPGPSVSTGATAAAPRIMADAFGSGPQSGYTLQSLPYASWIETALLSSPPPAKSDKEDRANMKPAAHLSLAEAFAGPGPSVSTGATAAAPRIMADAFRGGPQSGYKLQSPQGSGWMSLTLLGRQTLERAAAKLEGGDAASEGEGSLMMPAILIAGIIVMSVCLAMIYQGGAAEARGGSKASEFATEGDQAGTIDAMSGPAAGGRPGQTQVRRPKPACC